MKKYTLLLTLPLVAMAISGCGKNSSTGSVDPSTDTGSTTPSTDTSVDTGGSITRPGSDEGGEPTKSTSMEKALQYNYSNVALNIDTVFGEMETYYQEFYDGNRILSYTPEMAANYGYEYAFEEFYVTDDGISYKWFDQQSKSVLTDTGYVKEPFGKGGWMNKGWHNADLSIWKANFYLPQVIESMDASDFTKNPLGIYYIEDAAKREAFIDAAFSWVLYDTEGAGYPVDVSIILDSETSEIKKIYGFFSYDENDESYIEVEFTNRGVINLASIYPFDLHDAPNESNITHYWEYYGWPHDYVEAYYKSLRLEIASSSNDHVTINGNSVVMDIDKTFGVNLITDPVKFEAWDLVDYEHSQITYEYDKSIIELNYSFDYSVEVHSLKPGSTTIKATVLGENGRIFSNEIAVTVNEAPTQDLTNAIYKFSWVGYVDDEDVHAMAAVNDYGNGLPFTITTSDQKGTFIRESKYSSMFEAGSNLLAFAPSQARKYNADGSTSPSDKTSIMFDFDDQQVNELSFNYAGFYSGQLLQFLDNLESFTISTSNDGVEWTDYNYTADLKEEMSDDFVKLFVATFAPSSKVKLTFDAFICGKDGILAVDSLAFSADETCHDHNEVTSVPVTGVGISKSLLSLDVGNTHTLQALVQPSNATNANVTWSSSNPEVASVSESGLVTALSVGSTIVTVRTVDGGFTATCNVTVSPRPEIPSEYAGTYWCDDRDAQIVLDSTNNTCAFSSPSYSVTLPLQEYNASDREMVFSDGSDTLVVCKDSDGVYIGTSGRSRLNGSNLQGNWDFVKMIAPTSFDLSVYGLTANSDGNYEVLVGDDVIVTAKNIKPTDANQKDVVWEVINGTGSGTYDEETSKFHAVSAGTVTLKATMNGNLVRSVTFVISNPIAVSSITVTAAGGATSVTSGKTLQLTATVNPTNASNKEVTWSSSNTAVASVDAKGLVTAKSVSEAKTVTITATSKANGEVAGSITLTVQPAPTSGVVPAGLVHRWSLTYDYGTAEIVFSSDGKVQMFGKSFASCLEGELDSVSGNVYTFIIDVLGESRELVVTWDGDTISECTFDDTDGYYVYYDIIEFTDAEIID